MRKVTTINLNNNAYQIDEDGYEALRAYLDAAERALANNPDRAEILADLEQAIADKCRLALGPYKTVVSAAEIERILKEMGPVEGSAASAGAEQPASGAAGTASGNTGSGSYRPRRLYRIREGEKWAGVCTGLSAYAGVDVAWVRVAFIMLTVFTGGFWLVAYIAMVFVLPIADTPEEIAAAHGQPFSAQELVDRVKKKHDEFRDGRRSRRERMRRHSQWWAPPSAQAPIHQPGYAARVAGGVMLPVFTVLSACWFVAMATAFMAMWWAYQHGWHSWSYGGQTWTADLPRWIVLVGIFAVYALLAMPLGAARRAARYYANGGQPHGWADAWSGMLWIAIVCIALWALWQFTPWAPELFHNIFQEHHHTVSV